MFPNPSPPSSRIALTTGTPCATQIAHYAPIYGTKLCQQVIFNSYDAEGNIVESRDIGFLGGSRYTTYVYDLANELTQDWTRDNDTGATLFGNDYAYDCLGNRVGAKRTNPSLPGGYTYSDYHYASSDKFLDGEGYAVAAYDFNGAPRSLRYPDGTTSQLAYDAEHQLLSFGAHGTTPGVGFAYDAAGRRVQQFGGSAGAAKTFVFDGDDAIAEIDGANRTYRTPGVGFVDNGVPFYERENAQGSVVSVVDRPGAMVSRTFYDAYGQTVPIINGPHSRHGFVGSQGYAEDGASGALLCGARFYLPAIGRFLTPDPIGHEGGPNLYRYCENNPVLRADPSGLSPFDGIFAAARQVPFFNSYGSQDGAVAAMASFIWPASWAQHREFGGFVSKMSNGRFRLKGFYKSPGGYGGTVDVPGVSFEATAFWHTHPYTSGMSIPGSLRVAGDPDVFSRPGTAADGPSGDIAFFGTFKVDGYLISPFLIRRFDRATRDESNIPYRNTSGTLERWKP